MACQVLFLFDAVCAAIVTVHYNNIKFKQKTSRLTIGHLFLVVLVYKKFQLE